MSIAHTTGVRVPFNSAPRGAHWLGSLAAAVIAGVRRLDRWQVARSAALPTDADGILAWASQIEHSDPGFASDLRGAALRSMGQHDIR
jgi:hypothetical protein